MENRSHALAAGLFVLVLTAALAAIGLWFSKDDGHVLTPYVVTTTGDVSGLKPEAPVRYRGVDVGKVYAIRLDPARPGVIEIRIGVDAATPVTSTTYAQLGYLGVTGITFISLQDKAQGGGERVASSRDKPGVIAMRPSLMDSGENLLGSVAELVERASALLNEENRGHARQMLVSAEQATTRVAKLAERLEPAASSLPALVEDARSMTSAVKTAALRVDELGGTLNKVGGTINQMAQKVESRLDTLTTVANSAEEVGQMARMLQDETVPRLNSLADGLTRQTRSLDRVIRTLGDHPQSLVFGTAPARAGPGESGFRAGAEQ